MPEAPINKWLVMTRRRRASGTRRQCRALLMDNDTRSAMVGYQDCGRGLENSRLSLGFVMIILENNLETIAQVKDHVRSASAL